MARGVGIGPVYQGSLLDRLVQPGSGRGDIPSLSRLRDGLRRDLESLLNTRRRFLSWPSKYGELDRSLLAYGLPDFSHESLGSAAFRQDFAADVARVLARLEPRMQVHEVQLLDNSDPLDRRLRFRIQGMVRFGEDRHSLSFDSVIDPVECDIVVRDQ